MPITFAMFSFSPLKQAVRTRCRRSDDSPCLSRKFRAQPRSGAARAVAAYIRTGISGASFGGNGVDGLAARLGADRPAGRQTDDATIFTRHMTTDRHPGNTAATARQHAAYLAARLGSLLLLAITAWAFGGTAGIAYAIDIRQVSLWMVRRVARRWCSPCTRRGRSARPSFRSGVDRRASYPTAPACRPYRSSSSFRRDDERFCGRPPQRSGHRRTDALARKLRRASSPRARPRDQPYRARGPEGDGARRPGRASPP